MANRVNISADISGLISITFLRGKNKFVYICVCVFIVCVYIYVED